MAKIEIKGTAEKLERVSIFLRANNIEHSITEDYGNHSKEEADRYQALIRKFNRQVWINTSIVAEPQARLHRWFCWRLCFPMPISIFKHLSTMDGNQKDKSGLTAIYSSIQQDTPDWDAVLRSVISHFDCSTGTLHFLDQETSLLKLKAQKGIPSFLIPKVEVIPIGKGMAGIAAERREAVEMCNLQTDDSGVARPAAKETKMEGSIAAPLLLNGTLYGTIGIAKPVPYDFTEEEKSKLLKIGEAICEAIS